MKKTIAGGVSEVKRRPLQGRSDDEARSANVGNAAREIRGVLFVVDCGLRHLVASGDSTKDEQDAFCVGMQEILHAVGVIVDEIDEMAGTGERR